MGYTCLEWTDCTSLQSKGLSRVFSNTTVQKHQFFGIQLPSQSNSHPYMTNGKTIALTRQTFAGRVMSLLLSMPSRLVITFLPRSKRLLISWLQSPSAVILEPKKIVCVCLCSCILQHCCTLISSHVFFVTFIRFSTCSQICDLQIMTALFHYQSECLYFFSLPISLANPTSTMLNRSSESRHSGFVPDFMYSVFLSN